MGVVVVKFKHTIARVLKRIEFRAGRRVTFRTGVAAPFVTLLPVGWSWAPTSLCRGGHTMGSWPPRASHRASALSQQPRPSCGCLRQLPPSWKAVGVLKSLTRKGLCPDLLLEGDAVKVSP